MEERRQYPRREVDEPAYIFGDGSSTRCSIINMSEDGAAIELPKGFLPPDQFQLMLLRDRIVRNCRMVWTMRDRIGVQFTQAAPKAGN
jgi:hypothetical protein